MRKFLGVLFIVVTTVLGLVLGVVWSVRTSLIGSSAPITTALRNGRVYDRALNELLPQFVNDPSRTGSILANVPVSAADLTTIVQQTITANYLQQQVERSLGVAFDVVYGRTNVQTMDFVIPLQDVKRRLPIAIQDRLAAELRALPVCATDQLADYQKRKDLNSALPPCLPKGTDVQQLIAQSGKITDITKNIPETLDVGNALRTAQPDSSGHTPEQSVEKIQSAVRLGMRGLWGVTVLWLLIVLGTAALFIPHWRRVLQWLGASLACASTLFLAGTIVGWQAVPKTLTAHDQFGQVIVTIFQPVGRELVGDVYHRMLLIASLGIILAIASFVAAYFLPNAKRLKS